MITDRPPSLAGRFHMEFPDLVEIRITKQKGLFRIKFYMERYVEGKLIAASWVGLNDIVRLSIKLDGWTE